MPKFDKDISVLDPMAKTENGNSNETSSETEDNAALIAKILANPEAAALLKMLAKTI